MSKAPDLAKIKTWCWTCPCFAVWDCRECDHEDECADCQVDLFPSPHYPATCKPQDCVAAKKAHYLAMRAVLEAVEWIDFERCVLICPICDHAREAGHAPDCKMGLVLGRLVGKDGGHA